MTVATEKTDAFLRYIRSAEVNKLKGKVLKMYSNKSSYLIINTANTRNTLYKQVAFIRYVTYLGSWHGGRMERR